MIQFLLYLTPTGQQIVSSIMQRNYNIKENAPICRNKELMGIVQTPNFVICLNNIKNGVSPVDYYVNETVYHEAVHVAQACKNGPLGVNVSLDPYKMNDVVRSVKIGGAYPVYESEAYFLEDKPEQVLYYLKKFCF
jgi:hypothetical protein